MYVWSSWVHDDGGLFDQMEKFRQLSDEKRINMIIEVAIFISIFISFYSTH